MKSKSTFELVVFLAFIGLCLLVAVGGGK